MESGHKKSKLSSSKIEKNKEEKCDHIWEYNDETMGGIGSFWYRRCVNCTYFEKE